MNRRRRTEILIKGNKNLAGDIAKSIIEKYEVQDIEVPNNGLAMIKMRETAKRELFYLGEVLITEAKVFVNGTLGMGVVAGDDEELARNLALIDAAFKHNVKEVTEWSQRLELEEVRIKELENIRENKILATKVDFSTMDV